MHPIVNMTERILQALVRNPVLMSRPNGFILVNFGPVSAMIAFVGFFCSLISLRAFGMSRHFVSTWSIMAPLAMLAGSFILPKLLNLVKSPQCFLDNLGKITFTFLGGFLGVVITSFYLAISLKESILFFSDGACVVIPLFHGLSRFACLNYGCCHGRPLTSKNIPAVVYTHKLSKAVRVSRLGGIRLHAVQIYELFLNMVIQLVLILMIGRTTSGAIASNYFILYGLTRMFLHKFRYIPPSSINPLPFYDWLMVTLFFGAGLVYLSVSGSAGVPHEFSLQRQYFTEALTLIPIIAIMSLMIAMAYGFHYKKVGQWF